MLLRPHADASVDRCAGDRRVHGQGVEVLQDLRGQLARRRQHERLDRAARPIDQPIDNREQERCGLPAAGLGARDQVPALEARWNGFGLDRSGTNEAEVFDRLDERRVQVEVSKGHPSLSLWDTVSRSSVVIRVPHPELPAAERSL